MGHAVLGNTSRAPPTLPMAQDSISAPWVTSPCPTDAAVRLVSSFPQPSPSPGKCKMPRAGAVHRVPQILSWLTGPALPNSTGSPHCCPRFSGSARPLQHPDRDEKGQGSDSISQTRLRYFVQLLFTQLGKRI